jgi:CrcB protein
MIFLNLLYVSGDTCISFLKPEPNFSKELFNSEFYDDFGYLVGKQYQPYNSFGHSSPFLDNKQGIGTVFRYLLSKNITSNFTHINAIGTLTANLLASLLLAILIYFVNEKSPMSINWKLFLVTGLCGGFSTFSTFSYETYELFKLNMPIYAILNILISIGLGIFLMFTIDKLA